ncbi:MAG: hypothetical protein AAF431_01155 [Pseudomonadota bacterium]
MKICLTIAALLTCALMVQSAYAGSVYSQWHSEIYSITPAGNVYIYIDGNVEINPAGCSSGNGYILAKDHDEFDMLYKAILAAFISGTQIRAIVDDGPTADTCYNGKPKIKWMNFRR